MAKRLVQADGAAVYDISRARLVQAIRALHHEYGVYQRCGHAHSERDPEALHIDGVGWTCTAGLLATICAHCCVNGVGQREDCATEHKHVPGRALCPTMAIVDGREAPWQ